MLPSNGSWFDSSSTVADSEASVGQRERRKGEGAPRVSSPTEVVVQTMMHDGRMWHGLNERESDSCLHGEGCIANCYKRVYYTGGFVPGVNV